MLTLPNRWAPDCASAPRMPLLGLPGRSLAFHDPIVLAECLNQLLPVHSCDPIERVSATAPFRCHAGALALGPLELVALWGTGLRGEVEGTDLASVILPYRGEGRFRIEGRSYSNRTGQTLLLLPPGPWRTRNDVMGGVTIRVKPEQLQAVGRTMAGPMPHPERWLGLGQAPRVLTTEQPGAASALQRLYWVLEILHALLLRLGSVPETLRLDDLLLRQIVAALAPALLAEASDAPGDEDRLEVLIDWMHAHADQPISLTDLEQRSHYSRRSLQNAFNARFGCGPMQYLRRQRLWQARRLLLQARPGSTVGSIAVTCGYLNVESFRRDFHMRFGRPPSQLLAEARSGRQGAAKEGRISPARSAAPGA